MLSSKEQSRYSKQIILPEIGIAGQERLCAARVLVIGAGGLGCPVLQYLAAAGVGTIGIADGDTIDISNLQRQVLYTEAEIGQQKAAVAAAKLRALNPGITITTYPFFADSTNILELIRGYDIVVDGSDNFETRYLVNDACVMLNKPMVSGAIYKFEGQVSVFNYNNGPTYRCIFPEPPNAEDSPNCADIGVIAALPGIIGTIQANEVIKMITGIGEVLSGKLLVIDTLTMNTHTFNFKLNPANKNITGLKEYHKSCDIQHALISYAELKELLATDPTAQLVDVREPQEHFASNIGGINIPLSEMEHSYHLLVPDKTVVLYCASGVRSATSATLLIAKGFSKVVSLQNGINGL
jgi:molybdopterin/thiamine biosynthesis adenylyltransferase/rhodanese-related sulfurtransferase